jgi:DNA-binding MarR family transcriptional regulator
MHTTKTKAEADQTAEAVRHSITLLVQGFRRTRDESLSVPETAVLHRLERGGPTTVTGLARLERITAQSVGATLTALEARGLVKRRPDPEDGRRTIVTITARGGAVLRDRTDARARQIARALRDGFNERELEVLRKAAPLLERLAERM